MLSETIDPVSDHTLPLHLSEGLASAELLARRAEEEAQQQLASQAEKIGEGLLRKTVVPLATELDLYVPVKWVDRDSDAAMKTTYSSGSEAGSD
ncbi:MAG: hypothetical protein AAB834_00580 [Patescibacteria group bacterium]